MRTLKTTALALVVAATLAAPAHAAVRQTRDQRPDRDAVQRIVQMVTRFFGAVVDDVLVVPHP